MKISLFFCLILSPVVAILSGLFLNGLILFHSFIINAVLNNFL